MKYTAWESLCVHYCWTYGLNGNDLFGADEERSCYRRRGPGPRAQQYPSLLVATTLPFLLLASQRVTNMPIDWIAKCLQLDEWDALDMLTDSEKRLVEDELFAQQFAQFLESYRDERAQAHTIQKNVAMTYEEIAAELGLCWQRVQQIEKEALEKLRNNPEAIALLMEAM